MSSSSSSSLRQWKPGESTIDNIKYSEHQITIMLYISPIIIIIIIVWLIGVHRHQKQQQKQRSSWSELSLMPHCVNNFYTAGWWSMDFNYWHYIPSECGVQLRWTEACGRLVVVVVPGLCQWLECHMMCIEWACYLLVECTVSLRRPPDCLDIVIVLQRCVSRKHCLIRSAKPHREWSFGKSLNYIIGPVTIAFCGCRRK